MGQATVIKIKDTGEAYDVTDLAAREAAASAAANAEYARQVDTDTYAGQNLATTFATEIAKYDNPWAWLRARTRAGNFAGLRIRDYINVTLTNGNSIKYQIGAIDPYYLCDDQGKGHHVAMVPSAPVAVSGDYAVNTSYIMWNTTNTNQGTATEPHPYLASNLHKWETEVFYPMLPQTVRDNIKNQRVILDERYSAAGSLTESNSWSWADLGPIWSPSEVEVYGQNVWSKPGYGTGFDCQFPLFKQTKDRIQGSRIPWWLRSVSGSSASSVCCVYTNGLASYYAATNDWIRPLPCFLVG